MTGRSFAGWDFCVGIARALGEPPEKIFRLAGLLPPLPPAVEEEHEALTIFPHLLEHADPAEVAQLLQTAGIRIYCENNQPTHITL